MQKRSLLLQWTISTAEAQFVLARTIQPRPKYFCTCRRTISRSESEGCDGHDKQPVHRRPSSSTSASLTELATFRILLSGCFKVNFRAPLRVDSVRLLTSMVAPTCYSMSVPN